MNKSEQGEVVVSHGAVKYEGKAEVEDEDVRFGVLKGEKVKDENKR